MSHLEELRQDRRVTDDDVLRARIAVLDNHIRLLSQKRRVEVHVTKAGEGEPARESSSRLLPLMATAVVVPYDEAEHGSMPVAIAVPASPARTHVDSETESVDSGATIPPSPLAAEQYDSEEL